MDPRTLDKAPLRADQDWSGIRDKSFLHSFIKTLDAAFGSLKRRKSKNEEDVTGSNNLEEHGKIFGARA